MSDLALNTMFGWSYKSKFYCKVSRTEVSVFQMTGYNENSFTEVLRGMGFFVFIMIGFVNFRL